LRKLGLHHASNGRLLLTVILSLTVLAYGWMIVNLLIEGTPPAATFLTEPFLQLPTVNSVRVVWFTEFAGDRHQVEYGQNFQQVAFASTTKLSRVREDQKSRVGAQTQDGQVYSKPTLRDIWRHEAEVQGLTATRLPYRVSSDREDGQRVRSREFTLAPLPLSGTPLKILLTSDHQLMPMTPANLQKVVETVGRVDAVFMAGDLVNISDRASEWFDDNRGGAFFPSLQGRANSELEKNGVKTRYAGGEIIQHAPLFPAVGNHEVMGRFSMATNLNEQFNDAYPQSAAAVRYREASQQINPTDDPRVQAAWIKNASFNIDTYQEIFTLPDRQKYYAITFGDVRLVVLYATNIWRRPAQTVDVRGRYQERQADLEHPENWGYGQHIFEPIAPGSPQYTWLQAELNTPEFQQAKYKIVMLHHPLHSLGDNIVPAYTDPVQIIDRHPDGRVRSIHYEYPQDQDYLIRDIVPLLETAGVQLVFYGHSHLWNRFISPDGMNFLESSNVGNTYGAFMGDKARPVPTGLQEHYAATGDPNGLEPVLPNIAPVNTVDQPQPYIASNDITVFSILDTGTGRVISYRFDTTQPQSSVVKFDEFPLQD
jgi:Calcineurin-like phosphoesterase